MLKVYLETTIPSYLASRPSRDVIVAAQQQVTLEWWENSRPKYDLFISEAVIDECQAGDPEAAKKRIGFIKDLSVLSITDDVIKLAEIYAKLLNIPDKAKVDAIHISIAVVYEMDYLITWNCTHLAHGEIRSALHRYNMQNGLYEPTIVTPFELL